MDSMNNPSKEQVRKYLARRWRDSKPPPSQEEVRRQVGWKKPAR